MTNIRGDRRFYVILLLAGLPTFLVHELAHWTTGMALGYPSVFHLNGVETPGASVADATVVSAAGPVVTIAQGMIGYAMVRARGSMGGLAIVLWAAAMRLIASIVSLAHPNDEARVGTALGLGMWTLPLVVTLGLAWLAVAAWRRTGMTWKDALASYAVLSISSALIVGGDMMMRR